jgi:steroid delta-isomerase-like uncharacterized protein
MRSVKTLSVVLAIGLVAIACKKKDDAAAKPPETKQTEAPKPPEPPPPKAMTAEETADWYQKCWAAFPKDMAALKACFSDTASCEQVDSGMPAVTGADCIDKEAKVFADAFPDVSGSLQLVLVSGKNVASVVLVTGTHTGTLKGPMGDVPATNKKIGMLEGHVITVGDDNKVAKQWFFADSGEMMFQLGLAPGPGRAAMDKGADKPMVVIAKDDDGEKKNLEASKAWVEAFNKHDTKALAAMYAKGYKHSESAAAEDMDGNATSASLDAFAKGFPDVKITVENEWAAGDYTIATGTWGGTNNGDMPMMKLKKTGKAVSVHFFEVMQWKDGKLVQDWTIFNSAAVMAQLGMGAPPPGGKPADGGKAAPAPKKKGK